MTRSPLGREPAEPDPKGKPRRDAVERLLGAVTAPWKLTRLLSGRNNQSFRLDVGSDTFFLKRYFYHPHDPRDRLATEFGFSTYCWSQGIRCIAEPIACGPDDRLALFSFLDGRRPSVDELNIAAVQEAADFFGQINRARDSMDARRLPSASEACFSIADHVGRVHNRIDKLQHIASADEIDEAAIQFVQHDLRPAFLEKESELRSQLRDDEFHHVLSENDRHLSPSDFGFHNALRRSDGSYAFFDFEYAGWDDAAKLVCDFFCQVEVPIPIAMRAPFVERICQSVNSPDKLLRRIDWLLPVYRLKWCCILLNEFLPTAQRRRDYSQRDTIAADRRSSQLLKAQELLKGRSVASG